MPGPRLAPKAHPQAWPTPEPRGTGRLGLAVGGKEAAPGAAGPEAAAFVGVLRAREEGRNDTARPGSRGWGDTGQGLSRGSRSGTPQAGGGTRTAAPDPRPARGPRKRRGHSHGCAGLRGLRTLRTLVAARLGRAAAAAVTAAAARPSLCSAACSPDAPLLPWPAGPHPLRSRGSRTPGGAHGSLRPLG